MMDKLTTYRLPCIAGIENDADPIFEMITLIQEEERVKLGQELHDGVSPLLVVANLYLDFVRARTELETLSIGRIRASVLSAIESIRSISARLVVSKKLDGCLIHLITQLINTIGNVKPFEICFEHSPEDLIAGINPEVKLAVYRIVQEQMNNIIKHSKADHVEIRMVRENECLHLMISDDGVGFDPTKPASGIGLTNIEARIKQLEGSMTIMSSPGKGCRLEISLAL